MSLFNKLFKKTSEPKLSSKDKQINEQPVNLSLDDLFVHNFINKGGKFLYCENANEAAEILVNILHENDWNQVSCLHPTLKNLCNITQTTISTSNTNAPFFTNCEHLVADTGNIMLSSNQIVEMRLGELNDNFIVLAQTSQIVKNMGEGLTGIKSNCKGILPSNICDIRNYNANNDEDNFMSYGNSNTKNLYLILVEDL
ncbi:lactate utilization protein [Flavobacteriaceae bacterium]|nr:lactate utilization protein [Flavobacteriaceae bacterium]